MAGRLSGGCRPCFRPLQQQVGVTDLAKGGIGAPFAGVESADDFVCFLEGTRPEKCRESLEMIKALLQLGLLALQGICLGFKGLCIVFALSSSLGASGAGRSLGVTL